MARLTRKFLVAGVPSSISYLSSSIESIGFLVTGEEQVYVTFEDRGGQTSGSITARRKLPHGSDTSTTIISASSAHTILNEGRLKPLIKCIKVFKFNGILMSQVKYSSIGIDLFNISSAVKSPVPSFFGEEVTNNPTYTDEYLWRSINGRTW